MRGMIGPTLTIADIDALISGATPQFSQQIRERLLALIATVPEGSDVHSYGKLQLGVLERMAMGTTRGTRAQGVPPVDDEGWSTIPSHPRGGISAPR